MRIRCRDVCNRAWCRESAQPAVTITNDDQESGVKLFSTCFSELFPECTVLGSSRKEDPGLWASEAELADKWMDDSNAGYPPSMARCGETWLSPVPLLSRGV